MSERVGWTTRWIALVWIALSTVVPAQGQSGDPLAKLTVEDELLTWDGLRLGMSLVQAERRIGVTLALERSKASGCPAYIVRVDHHGLALTIGFAAAKPSAKVEWFQVRFEGDLVLPSRLELAAALRQKIAGVEWLRPAQPADIAEEEDLQPSYAIPGKEAQVVRFAPREWMIVAKRACLGV